MHNLDFDNNQAVFRPCSSLPRPGRPTMTQLTIVTTTTSSAYKKVSPYS